MTELIPSHIYFTHSVINYKFSGCGKLLENSLNELITNPKLIYTIPQIKVFYIINNNNIKYYSENNRRLWLFKELEKKGLLDKINVRLEKAKNAKYYKNTYSMNVKIKKH